MATLDGHEGEVRAVTADFGCMQALSVSEDTTLKLWDLRERRCVVKLEGHEDVIEAVAVAPLAVINGPGGGCPDSEVRRWMQRAT